MFIVLKRTLTSRLKAATNQSTRLLQCQFLLVINLASTSSRLTVIYIFIVLKQTLTSRLKAATNQSTRLFPCQFSLFISM